MSLVRLNLDEATLNLVGDFLFFTFFIGALSFMMDEFM